MIPRDYQAAALASLERWLTVLAEKRAESEAAEAAIAATPALRGIPVPDWTERAWEALRTENRLPSSATFSPRRDAAGRPVPNATLKVPTGGGKTFLAAASIAPIQRVLVGADAGLILWVVPNDAIYRQTLTRLRDRADPYRQALDRAGAGRVRIATKDDPLDARDVAANLVVLVLMLQSANREDRESLKIFRESGRVRGFVPAAGDVLAHHALLARNPHLQTVSGADPRQMGTEAVESLGNALALSRPVVIIDEGQKAISDLAQKTIQGFGPRLILELTATPRERPDADPPIRPNILVDVRGAALLAEEMIKLPIEVETYPGDDWRAALLAALAQLNALRDDAEALQADGGARIRPIMIVQAERVGKDQRDTSFIHAADVRGCCARQGCGTAATPRRSLRRPPSPTSSRAAT
ncbi:DEAD/DEAH box helicase family protein (plasmid) [Roseomonas sp. CCTCC AB2023176]|uniref:DEAD/DEAH box helicase family protein n=1 Tax=Roseomonas sp. CCTCC AB2023176 TaxID=3342640 RepID=UPI0035DE379D